MMFSVDDRILFYPVDRTSLPIIKSTANYPNIRVCRLVSPKSWGYEGESYECSDGMVVVSHDYETELDDCTTVWIVDSWNELDFKQFIEPSIRLAAEKGKRIVCSKKMTETEISSLSDIDVTYIGYSVFANSIDLNDRIQEVRTPIVCVMSSTEYCNQLFVETAIRAELKRRGYEVLLISSQKEGVVFDGCTIPSLMFSGDYSENEKVIALNRYIRNLEMKHHPDVIIVGMPGAAVPYDFRYSSDFGILAYEVSEAVKSDFSILLSPCMLYDMVFFKGIEDSLRGRLGIHIDVHSLSPYALDFITGEKIMSYLSVDEQYIRKMIEQANYDKLINMNNIVGVSTAVDRLIDKLSSNMGSLIT